MTVLPFSPVLNGQLFLYARGRAAFESPLDLVNSPNKCILLGGLSDGLLPVPYTASLEQVCQNASPQPWSLVQPILSSSYTGFGHGTLERDTQELNQLLTHLIEHRSAHQLCLVGHSTGCQNAVHYLKHGDPDCVSKIRVIALQAPVSDREHAMTEPGYQQNLETAQAMRQNGQSQEMMPRDAFWAPITAKRFLALQERGGMDDFFSSDYSNEELMERLRHVGANGNRRVLVAFSGADEYVPSHVNKQELTDRLVQAMNRDCPENEPKVAQALYLPTGIHNLESEADGRTFVNKVAELLNECASAD